MIPQPIELVTTPELGRLAAVPAETARRRLSAAGYTPEYRIRMGSGRAPVIAFHVSKTAELLQAISLR